MEFEDAIGSKEIIVAKAVSCGLLQQNRYEFAICVGGRKF
jgi:hypothetical protein